MYLLAYGRAVAFPVRNAEDVSEQRGWAPRALRRYVRARRSVSFNASKTVDPRPTPQDRIQHVGRHVE